MTNFEKIKEEIDSVSVRDFASCFGDFICKYIPRRVCDRYKKPYVRLKNQACGKYEEEE